MPHDAYGNALRVGDIVYVPAKVKEIHDIGDYCNIVLETERSMYPTSQPTILQLNAQQVDKIFNRENPPSHSRRVA